MQLLTGSTPVPRFDYLERREAMIIWIICWTNSRGVPDMDVFTDAEQAQRCLAFVTENCNNAIMRKIEIRKEEPEQAANPDAELTTLPDDSESEKTE